MDIRECYHAYVGAESFWFETVDDFGRTWELCLSLAQMAAEIAALDQIPSVLPSHRQKGLCYRPSPVHLRTASEVMRCLRFVSVPRAMLNLCLY